jgi:hypothetical protein
MTDEKEKPEAEEGFIRLHSEVNKKFDELLKQDMFYLTRTRKPKYFEFNEMRVLMKGMKSGAELYSAGIMSIIKNLNLEEFVIDYIGRLIKINDYGIFNLLDSFSPPPPRKGNDPVWDSSKIEEYLRQMKEEQSKERKRK